MVFLRRRAHQNIALSFRAERASGFHQSGVVVFKRRRSSIDGAHYYGNAICIFRVTGYELTPNLDLPRGIRAWSYVAQHRFPTALRIHCRAPLAAQRRSVGTLV
jgi:hypothetical protein